MSWILGMVVMSLAVGVVVTAVMRFRHAWRWGQVPSGTTDVGDGPYRQEALPVLRPREVPGVVQTAAVTSIAWGLVTGFVFAPAGLLFVLVLLDGGAASALVGVAILAASLHGFVLAVRLCRASSALLRRESDSVRRVSAASLWHHAFVIAAFAAATLAMREREPVLWLLVVAGVPCLVGLLHTHLLSRAALLTEVD